MARKLASLQRIASVSAIEGADLIEKVGILGWHCVAKKGEFRPGDLCVYFEIDSLLPEQPEFEFLRKSSWNSVLKKFRLRSTKLRGVLSQGLSLPMGVFPVLADLAEGDDVTALLGVEKFEPSVPAHLQGMARAFSWPVSKTDEPRVESEPELLAALQGKAYYITEKLDGTSATYLVEGGEFHACSRNLSLVESETNLYWTMAKQLRLEEILRQHEASTGQRLAIQGEICGPGVQGNPLHLEAAELFVFSLTDVGSRARLTWAEMVDWCQAHGLSTVPLLEAGESFAYGMAEIFSLSEAKTGAEGVVVRAQDQSVSFKKINNHYLLKRGE